MASKLKLHRGLRLVAQAAFAALTNGYAQGFVSGRIYTGSLKQVCVPGLNCYACPGALGSCPIGALQAQLTRGEAPLYALGFIFLFGALIGRLTCGFLCPFGLLQDLLWRVPLPKRLKRLHLPGHRVLKYLKYGILLSFVITLPLMLIGDWGLRSPQFCKWLCPSGTLAGVLLLSRDAALRAQIGAIFWIKLSVLGVVLLSSMVIYRPFCKYLCPLGALYAPMNKASVYRLRVEEASCTHCGACAHACKMGVRPDQTPNALECIRCGDCVAACPTRSLRHCMGPVNKNSRLKRL